MVGARAHQGGAGEAREVHPGYPGGRHITAAREALARLQIHSGDYAGAEATIATLSRSWYIETGPRCFAPASCQAGKHEEAIAARRADRLGRSGGLGETASALLAKAESPPPPRSSRKPRPCCGGQGSSAEDAGSQAPAYNTLGTCLRGQSTRMKPRFVGTVHRFALQQGQGGASAGPCGDRRRLPPSQAGRPRRRVHPAAQAFRSSWNCAPSPS